MQDQATVESRPEALDDLLPVVYAELRRRAHLQRLVQPSSPTLNTTAVVHEAYLRLAVRDDLPWQNENQFYFIASRAMRDVLVDHARKRRALKRGGDLPDLRLDDIGEISQEQLEEILELNEALDRLFELDARQAKTVELRYFIGLSIPEVADVLDVSPSTVKREWAAALAWLYRELER